MSAKTSQFTDRALGFDGSVLPRPIALSQSGVTRHEALGCIRRFETVSRCHLGIPTNLTMASSCARAAPVDNSESGRGNLLQADDRPASDAQHVLAPSKHVSMSAQSMKTSSQHVLTDTKHVLASIERVFTSTKLRLISSRQRQAFASGVQTPCKPMLRHSQPRLEQSRALQTSSRALREASRAK